MRKMSFRRVVPAVFLLLTWVGCSSREQTGAPAAPVADKIEVVGELVMIQDDRPSDGGVDLTLETDQGVRELVRVGSAFIAGPRDSVLAMHAVVDASKIGDRLRAVGTRDESGALRAETLEKVSEPTR